MRCPFFEEVLVAFCRAYPVRKMVPSDRLQANCLCTCDGFEECPLFREVMARVGGGEVSPPPADAASGGGGESSADQRHQHARSTKGV